MAANIAAAASSHQTAPTTSNNLSNFIPCQYTYVATKVKQDIKNGKNITDNQRVIVPRVCSLRKSDNTMAIYALVDPIDTNMIASDVSVNMLVEQLSESSFDDDSNKEKIDANMQKLFYEIENRLLQMTFDHAEEKVKSVTSAPSSVSCAEKLLPSLEEAESGAFLFAATVTQSNVYVAYVGTIRTFLISKNINDLIVSNERPQFYHTGVLHTIESENESLRLKKLGVDFDQVINARLDTNHSKFTRCLGKLSEKLLSSAASANDVSDARCHPFICEPNLYKFSIHPEDYALVMMTDKVYQMLLKIYGPEQDIPSCFINLLPPSTDSPYLAQNILDTIERRFQEMNKSSNKHRDFQDMGLLIHFFQKPVDANVHSSLADKSSIIRRTVDGEVTIDEVEIFINKNNEMQQKRDLKLRSSSINNRHERETQLQTSPIEPFVRFDFFEQSLINNEELNQANNFITDLLLTQPTSVIDQQLDDYLKEHPSLNFE